MKILNQTRCAVKLAIKSERGNVESFLVLIPLIILFLFVFQLVVALYQRNIATYEVQSFTNRIAINGRLELGPSVSSSRNDLARGVQNVDANIEVESFNIPNGGVLVIAKKNVEIPFFTTLFRGTHLGNLLKVRSLAYSEIN